MCVIVLVFIYYAIRVLAALVLQSSRWGRESLFHYFKYLPDALRLYDLVFCGSLVGLQLTFLAQFSIGSNVGSVYAAMATEWQCATQVSPLFDWLDISNKHRKYNSHQAGDKKYFNIVLDCRTSDLQFSLVLQTNALVL